MNARIRVKAVPGARRDEIVGLLGDRLKVRVSAPPEDGRANRAIAALIAHSLNAKPRDVRVVAGESSPEKIVEITGPAASLALDGRWKAAEADLTPRARAGRTGAPGS